MVHVRNLTYGCDIRKRLYATSFSKFCSLVSEILAYAPNISTPHISETTRSTPKNFFADRQIFQIMNILTKCNENRVVEFSDRNKLLFRQTVPCRKKNRKAQRRERPNERWQC
jgi:hypothetical protein